MGLTTIFTAVSLQFGLPQGLLNSVCFVESSNNPNVVHYHDGKGASYGLCQIKLTSARLVGFKGTKEDLMSPKTNIYYAGKYLQHQVIRYQSLRRGVIAYNLGHAGVLTSTKYQAKVYKQWGVQ
jgi:soluble lytic murein transglycosylase-like protein